MTRRSSTIELPHAALQDDEQRLRPVDLAAWRALVMSRPAASATDQLPLRAPVFLPAAPTLARARPCAGSEDARRRIQEQSGATQVPFFACERTGQPFQDVRWWPMRLHRERTPAYRAAGRSFLPAQRRIWPLRRGASSMCGWWVPFPFISLRRCVRSRRRPAKCWAFTEFRPIGRRGRRALHGG